MIARPQVIVGLVLAALFVGWTVIAYRHGVKVERADWEKAQRIAEAAARQTEHDLADLAAKGAARLAEKERLLDEQAKRSAETIRTMLASVPDCRVPRRVGRVLDATAGSLPATAEIPGSISPGPDDSALDAVVNLADILDTVNANYAICRANVERLTAARDWYEEIRSKVNQKE